MNHGVAAAALRRGRGKKDSKPRRVAGQSSYYNKVLALALTGHLSQGKKKQTKKKRTSTIGNTTTNRDAYKRPGRKHIDTFPKDSVLQGLGISGTALVVLGILACFVGFIEGLSPAQYVGFAMIGVGCPMVLLAVFCKRQYTNAVREGYIAENGPSVSTTSAIHTHHNTNTHHTEFVIPHHTDTPERKPEDNESEDLTSVPVRRFHTLSPMPELPSNVTNVAPLNTIPDDSASAADVEHGKY